MSNTPIQTQFSLDLTSQRTIKIRLQTSLTLLSLSFLSIVALAAPYRAGHTYLRDLSGTQIPFSWAFYHCLTNLARDPQTGDFLGPLGEFLEEIFGLLDPSNHGGMGELEVLKGPRMLRIKIRIRIRGLTVPRSIRMNRPTRSPRFPRNNTPEDTLNTDLGGWS